MGLFVEEEEEEVEDRAVGFLRSLEREGVGLEREGVGLEREGVGLERERVGLERAVGIGLLSGSFAGGCARMERTGARFTGDRFSITFFLESPGLN